MEIGTLCLLWLISWPLFSYVLEMYSIIASFWNLQNVLSLQMLQILLQKNAAWSRRFDREVVELRAAGKVIRSFFFAFFLVLEVPNTLVPELSTPGEVCIAERRIYSSPVTTPL